MGKYSLLMEDSTTRKNHIKKVKLVTIEITNIKIPRLLFQLPNIVITKEDARGLHFFHDDAMVIQLEIANKLVKRILVDNGNLVDLIFIATLRNMGWDLNNIEKVSMINLVGFNEEISLIIEKVTLHVETYGVTIY